jgi:hypothetical protein
MSATTLSTPFSRKCAVRRSDDDFRELVVSHAPLGFAGGDTNKYRYCGNSPTNGTDPTGLYDEKRSDVLLNRLRGAIANGGNPGDIAWLRQEIAVATGSDPVADGRAYQQRSIPATSPPPWMDEATKKMYIASQMPGAPPPDLSKYHLTEEERGALASGLIGAVGTMSGSGMSGGATVPVKARTPMSEQKPSYVASHVRFEKGEWFTWVPGISHLDNQNLLARVYDAFNGAPLDSYIKVFDEHGAIYSHLYSGGEFCCNGLDGLQGGAVVGNVTNLPPGDYVVTYGYQVTLRANGNAMASASITEGNTSVLNQALNGSMPIATFDSGWQTRDVQVTVGANGEATVFSYQPGATTGLAAGISDNSTANGSFMITGIYKCLP